MALSRTASPAAARGKTAWAAWLWLLLASIGAHAMLPVGSPLARGNGSAFSVATVEVALAPKRKAAYGKVTAQQSQPGAGAARDAGLNTDAALLPPSPVFAPASPLPFIAALRPASDSDAPASFAPAFSARAPPAA